MDVKEHFDALEKQSKETDQEQELDYVPRQKADHDHLFKTISNDYPLDSKEYRLYAEQIKVNEERNK